MAVSIFILLSNSHLSSISWIFHLPKLNSVPIRHQVPPSPSPHPCWPLASTNVLSDCTNLTILGTSYNRMGGWGNKEGTICLWDIQQLLKCIAIYIRKWEDFDWRKPSHLSNTETSSLREKGGTNEVGVSPPWPWLDRAGGQTPASFLL